MGCDYYTARWSNGELEDDSITFAGDLSNGDPGYVHCLCTFPNNYRNGFDAEIVRSLAYLGAAVAMMHHGEIDNGYLPHCLPDWIRDNIDKELGINKCK